MLLWPLFAGQEFNLGLSRFTKSCVILGMQGAESIFQCNHCRRMDFFVFEIGAAGSGLISGHESLEVEVCMDSTDREINMVSLSMFGRRGTWKKKRYHSAFGRASWVEM